MNIGLLRALWPLPTVVVNCLKELAPCGILIRWFHFGVALETTQQRFVAFGVLELNARILL